MQRFLALMIACGCGGSTPDVHPDAAVADAPVDTSTRLAIEIVSGNTQSATVHAPLPEPLVVGVKNEQGEPVAGVAVRFDTPANASAVPGVITTSMTETDANGLAQTTYVVGASIEAGVVTQSAVVLAKIDGTETAVGFTTTAVDMFAGHFNFTSPTETRKLGFADFDGDSRPDVFFVRSDTFTVALSTIAPGDHEPIFTDQFDFALPGPLVDARESAVGDLDGDGKLDVAVAYCGGTVAVLVNHTTTAPDFTPFTFATSGTTTCTRVELADINTDGKLDMVVFNSSTADVFLNTTLAEQPPTFSRTTIATIAGTFGSALADINGDGRPDLVLTSTTNVVSVMLNTTTTGGSSPTFQTSTNFPLAALASGITSADLDGDGKVDLVARVANGRIAVLANTTTTGSATPTFAPVVTVALEHNSTTTGTPIVGDFNHDGLLDIATAGHVSVGGNTFDVMSIVFRRPGTQLLFVPREYVRGLGTPDLAQPVAADLDGNGRLDLALTSASAMGVFVEGE